MAVSASDIKCYEAEYTPDNQTDPVGGGASATEVDETYGTFMPGTTANPDIEDDTIVITYKEVFKNEHATDSLYNGKLYILNALDDISSANTFSCYSSSESDVDKYLEIQGEDEDEEILEEEIIITGTTEAEGTSSFEKGFWAVVKDVNTGAVTNLVGDLTIEHGGTVIGTIPAGKNHAAWIFEIGIPAILNDTVQIANCLATPSGISFSKPRTYADGIDIPNSGELTAGDYIGVWVQKTVEGGLETSPYLVPEIRLGGTTV